MRIDLAQFKSETPNLDLCTGKITDLASKMLGARRDIPVSRLYPYILHFHQQRSDRGHQFLDCQQRQNLFQENELTCRVYLLVPCRTLATAPAHQFPFDVVDLPVSTSRVAQTSSL